MNCASGPRPNAALDALRDAVARSDAACRKDAAAAAWHAEPIVRFFCSDFGDGLAGVRVSGDNSIVITATPPGDGPVETSIAVKPEGSCACRMSAGDRHLASTAPDAHSFERILKSPPAAFGVYGQRAFRPRLNPCMRQRGGPCGRSGPASVLREGP